MAGGLAILVGIIRFNPLLIGAGALPRIKRMRTAKSPSFNPLLIGAGALPEIQYYFSSGGNSVSIPF